VSRAVVVGPYPPTADPAGAITLAEVRALRAAGHDVLVISPEPSAARVDADPATPRGARRIARLVRGADIVVWVGREPAGVVVRALRDVPEVRTRATASTGPDPRRLADRLRLARAGAPTFVRTQWIRRRRA
jgi:hypothetical protein